MTEEVIADGLESAKTWIREAIELQRQLVAEAGTRAPLAYVPQVDYGDDVAARVAEVGTDRGREGHDHHRPRPSATRPPTRPPRPSSAELAGEFEGREKEIKAAVRSLTKKLVRERIANDRRPHRRPRRRPTSGPLSAAGRA